MNFLKRLAFRLVRDDIEQVLKLHDERIMSHYMKIIDDVEDILENRKEEILTILKAAYESELQRLEISTEERLAEIKRDLEHDISNSAITVREVAGDIDLVELASELDYENLAASIDYSLINHKDLAKLVVNEPQFKIELDKASVQPLVQKLGQALVHYDDSRINGVRDALNILI